MNQSYQNPHFFWLSETDSAFPHPELTTHDGILAAGGDLSVERLLEAYKNGIFPWFNPEDPIIWWSPDPRFVLFPEDLRVSKSMRPYFNQKKYTVTFDTEFERVIDYCAHTKRDGQSGGTWITEDMKAGYVDLHRAGWAHSVEVRQEGKLVGGLYGVCIGKCFYGESMFAHASNASKFGFITLCRRLQELDFWIIDCQQPTQHLASLGAVNIRRRDFLKILKRNNTEQSLVGNWKNILTQNPSEDDNIRFELL